MTDEVRSAIAAAESLLDGEEGTAMNSRMGRRGVGSLAVCVALVTAACAPANDDSGEDDRSITIVLNSEPPTLESWTARSSFGYPVLRNVQEALINRHPESGELVPELATSWELVDNNTWRFHLREGVSFHDDSPLNAEAVAFALNYTWGTENNFAIRGKLGPEFVAEAVDDLTVDVVLDSPDPILPERLYLSPIFSKAAFDADPEAYVIEPIGTGPYRFVSWQRGVSIELESNPDWWGNTSPDAGGAIYFERATFLWRDESLVRATMVPGEADIARWVSPEECQNAPRCESGPTIETVILRLDNDPHPALRDVRVRRAIALAFDRDQIVSGIMGGGEVAPMVVSPSSIGFNDNLAPYPTDPEEARNLIEAARRDGVDVDAPLTVRARRDLVFRADEITEYIASAVQAVGLNTDTVLMETAAFEEYWIERPVPADRGLIGLHSHGNDLQDYSVSVDQYLSCEGSSSVLCDPGLERLHEDALGLVGEERDAAYQQIAQLVYDNVWIIPIGYPDFHFAVAEHLNWHSRNDGFLLLKEMSGGE